MTGNAKNMSGRIGSSLRIAGWSVAALVLLLPLVAMQFTEEVNWDVFDFAFAGGLLVGVGVIFELATRKTGSIAYRAAVSVALAAVFLLIWVNGAVGIIGSEDNGANVMYFGVPASGVIAALIARFKPQGMAYALFTTALAQALVAIIALVAGFGRSGPAWPREILLLTGFFCALWIGSALLFRKAAREQVPTAASRED